jgi:hypothetical protein
MFVAATAVESVAGCPYDESCVPSVHYGTAELEEVEVPEVQAVAKSYGPYNCAVTYTSRCSLVQ